MTTQSEQTTPCKSKCCSCSRWKIFLAILLLIGLGFAAGRFTSDHSRSMRHSFMEFRMNKMMDSIDATTEQRAKLLNHMNGQK